MQNCKALEIKTMLDLGFRHLSIPFSPIMEQWCLVAGRMAARERERAGVPGVSQLGRWHSLCRDG